MLLLGKVTFLTSSPVNNCSLLADSEYISSTWMTILYKDREYEHQVSYDKGLNNTWQTVNEVLPLSNTEAGLAPLQYLTGGCYLMCTVYCETTPS